MFRPKSQQSSEINQKQLNQLQVKYETEAMARENQLLKRDDELHKAKEKQQTLIIYLAILGLVFAIFFIGMLFRSNKIKRDQPSDRQA